MYSGNALPVRVAAVVGGHTGDYVPAGGSTAG